MVLETAQILRCRGVGRPADERRERADVANIVVARLLAEAAHIHVLDHARPQRADGPVGRMGGHRGLISLAEGCWTFDARDRMPRSSRLTAYPAQNARTVTRAPSRESGFVPGWIADLRELVGNERLGGADSRFSSLHPERQTFGLSADLAPRVKSHPAKKLSAIFMVGERLR